MENTAPSPVPKIRRYYRKIIKITALDSPNVRYGMAQKEAGLVPDNRIILPGVLSWGDYQKRLATWDISRQTVGLFAEFWEGADALLFPPAWIARAERIAEELKGRPRQAKAIGIDSAEGGDKTTMAVGDEFGLLELFSEKTPDTTAIPKRAIYLGRKWGVPPESWIFDRGGGGKQHADYLRDRGYNVQTIGFGEPVTPILKRGSTMTPYGEKIEQKEQKYIYKNRRAELYGELSVVMDPSYEQGYGIPAEYFELTRQLSLIPKQMDQEGRLILPPKNKKSKESKEITLVQIIGHSPDEADAVTMMFHGITNKVKKTICGVAF